MIAAVLVVATALTVACTPKPESAEPVAQAVLGAMSGNGTSELPGMIDNPDAAADVIHNSTSGLQAEGLEVEDLEVTQDGPRATASYRLVWDLPGERTFEYDTEMSLTRADDRWTATWRPTMIHPELGANQYLELRGIDARPASVVSSDGAELMSPGVVHRVLVDTDEMSEAEETATAVVDTLAAAHERDQTVRVPDHGDLVAALEGASGTYSVTTIPEAEGAPVAEALGGRPEISLNEEAAMVTVHPDFAPDTMARVGQVVADRLEGDRGWEVAAVNEHGAALASIERHAPEPAPAISVSLDYDVQRAAESAVSSLGDRQAVIVAVRPSTGQILAVAQSDAADRDGNIGLMGQYPPGSTFKIITAAAALERQGLTPDTIVGCPGSQNIYGRIVVNYNGFSLGNTSFDNAFAQSCNTTFADLSTQLEPGELADVAKQFGLGRNYVIPGLDTMTGSVPEGVTPLDRTEAGYGQGHDLSSPFGMAMVAATAAAGRAPTPVLIDGEETEVDGDVPAPDPAAIAGLQRMMRSVVTSGSAAGMSAAGEIHGKTGEAEVNDGSHAWFAGYRDDIAFSTLVVYGGGSTIAVNATDDFFNTLDEYRSQAD